MDPLAVCMLDKIARLDYAGHQENSRVFVRATSRKDETMAINEDRCDAVAGWVDELCRPIEVNASLEVSAICCFFWLI